MLACQSSRKEGLGIVRAKGFDAMLKLNVYSEKAVISFEARFVPESVGDKGW